MKKKVLQAFKEQEPFKECIEIVGTPQQALEKRVLILLDTN